MKKVYLLFFVLLSICGKAQFINQLTFKLSFTAHQVDSVIQAQGIPAGIFHPAYPVKVYKVVYNTVSWDSTSTIASGLLAVPVGLSCKTNIVSYQHGTTMKKSSAPSNLKGEWFIALAAASIGHVIVMPDYLGLGDGPGLHPYQHAHTEATAVIDLIRAAKEVVDTMGAPVNDQLFLFGYSEGGHATMAAHQLIQEKLDNVMHVTADASMSGAYDMSGVMGDLMTSNNPYPDPFYLPYLFFGYNQVYHAFTNDSDVFIHPYDSILRPLYDGMHDGWQVNNVMPNVPKLIMQQNQIDSFVNDSLNYFKVLLRQNNTYNWLPTSPIRMYYCQGDRNVPYQNAIVAYKHFKQNGATNVDTIDVNPLLDHVPCAQFAILGATYWFDSLAYKPLSSTTTVINATSSSSPNGIATANPLKGDSPFKFVWNTGDTTATIGNLAAGTYYVTITDESLCTKTDSAVVQLISGLQNEVLTNVRVYPNPTNGKITIENSNTGDQILLTEVFDISGRLIKTYAIKQGNNTLLYFDEATQGIYMLHLKAESGKEVWRKLTLL